MKLSFKIKMMNTNTSLKSSNTKCKCQVIQIKIVFVYKNASVELLSCVQLFMTPWSVARQPPLPWNSPGKDIGVGCHAFFQEIFPTQEYNPGLLHCKWVLYRLSHQGNPRILDWIPDPFSGVSSQHRNQTRVSCIAGRFSTR